MSDEIRDLKDAIDIINSEGCAECKWRFNSLVLEYVIKKMLVNQMNQELLSESGIFDESFTIKGFLGDMLLDVLDDSVREILVKLKGDDHE